MFNLKTTDQYYLIKKERYFWFLKWIGRISSAGFILCLISLVLRYFNKAENLSALLGWEMIFFSLLILSQHLTLFYNDCKKIRPQKSLKDALEKGANLAPFLNFNSAKYINKALKRNQFPSASILLYYFLDEKKAIL